MRARYLTMSATPVLHAKRKGVLPLQMLFSNGRTEWVGRKGRGVDGSERGSLFKTVHTSVHSSKHKSAHDAWTHVHPDTHLCDQRCTVRAQCLETK